MKNIEDWDFTHCTAGEPGYDAEADLFLSGHYVEVIAIEALRKVEISELVDAGLATPTSDSRFVILGHDGLLAGWQGGSSRLSRDGRLRRRIVGSLRREQKKNGRVRVELGAAARMKVRQK